MPENYAPLLLHYAPSGARYDEMLQSEGRPRAHWRAFLSRLAALPADTLERRRQFVNDSIASDGVTYNVYADPKGRSRPWELDLLPFILPANEWNAMATAVAQRARLLNAVLGDLYGQQTMLAEGLIPPALVFGQRNFLWPAHGIALPDGIAMHIYAADLARAPDGHWWVLADRTGGPSGAGYALQNRITLSRAFPDAFRDLHVEPLAPFFSALQDSLFRMSRPRGETPLAVLLTPGPYNETYFEHSFLARYLGFPLVEGQDLIVRGDAVYLKTLRGLRRVHAILRRLDDDYCDPVELRPDSALGVPGLLHAVRAGNVVLANALGSGVLETGALAGFYPALSERLFGEKLLMPSIATWWCGEAPALEYVIAHLDELVIKPAYPSIRMDAVFGHELDATGRARLVEKMQAQPHAYVAQEWVRLSNAPSWREDPRRLVPRAATLRVYAVATPNGYMVMPGALTRVARHEGDVVSMQWGGSSKDTWMLADRPVARFSLRRPRLAADDVVKSAVDIASRTGENLFWMGRYTERCEGIARLLRAALVRFADAAPDAGPALQSLASAGERLKIVVPRDAKSKEDADTSGAWSVGGLGAGPFVAAVVDPQIAGGLAANVQRLHGCANQVRERLSTDNWHLLNRLLQRLPTESGTLGFALAWVDEIMMACVSLAGFALDDMTRDESWQFLLLGRRLERLAHLSGLIAHVLGLPAAERAESLEWLLEATNSIVTFRARYRRSPELLPVLHLVVFDETNPHAVLFQARGAAGVLERIAGELGGDLSGDILTPLVETVRSVKLAAFEPESGPTLESACTELAALLGQAERAAFGLSDELQRRFFTHAETPVAQGIDGT